jgi:hypothetical protein
VAAYRATGAVTWVPFFLTLLADSEGNAKERDEGLGYLAEAERLMVETEEGWAEAELYRVRRECCAPVTTPPLPSIAFAKRSASRNSKARSSGSCAPRSVSPGSGASGASAKRPAVSSHCRKILWRSAFERPQIPWAHLC